MSALAELERLRDVFGEGSRKRELLRTLGRERLPNARQVERLHEALCFLRAYPDDERLLRQVERQLAAFARRPDLRRHAGALADTGIAGTTMTYPFFAATAIWLARRWPRQLALDLAPEGTRLGDAQRAGIERLLPLLALFAETPGLDEADLSVEEWLRLMKGRGESEAALLLRRLGALDLDGLLRDALYDGLDLQLVLQPGRDTPSRTRAVHRRGEPLVFQTGPLRRERPDLFAAIRRPPRAIRAVSVAEGRALIDLAREAMVARTRDLDAFMHGDPRDVRLVDCGDGLQFAAIGVLPERRLLLESVYGYLTLKNGVPVGYVLTSALNRSSEIAYNVFETFRGGEAAWIYGRVLATTRALFGSDTFTIYPYQLGQDNDEGLRSGAWWFYQKLGFRPRDAAVARLTRRELAAMRRRPAHRSSIATLRRLADANLYLSLAWGEGAAGRADVRADVIGEIALHEIGLGTTGMLARRFGSDRERADQACSAEAAELLGGGPAGWSAGERLAFRRWAPLVTCLPGVDGWGARERRALLAVVRAKGGRRESDFVHAFDAHRPLRRSLLTLARKRGAT